MVSVPCHLQKLNSGRNKPLQRSDVHVLGVNVWSEYFVGEIDHHFFHLVKVNGIIMMMNIRFTEKGKEGLDYNHDSTFQLVHVFR